MKSFIAVGIILLSILMALSFCVASEKDTVNSPVYLLSEHNLSIGLDSKFRVTYAGFSPVTTGLFMNSFGITGAGQKGMADLEIVSVSNITDAEKSLGSEVTMQLFSAGVISAYGNEVLGNWTTSDARGQNVIVQTIPTNKSSSMYVFGKTTDYATWSLGDDIYAVLLSQFDKDVTEKIIRTLNISS